MNTTASNPPSFWTIAASPAVVRRAARIALVVGVVIALINHGDKMMSAAMDGMSWLKCAMTFLVPYCVSTYSSVQAMRDRMRDETRPV
ncbi:nitrate/nitrite transporter NrtS [uncultured Tateyamaria sp.]|uniref:nitrate/nitrite transporter NrtS n=1 Tax=Tateyamaria sp. 1078 TaxID=3417464 RepID=UPI0026295329|nr:nitrate/nitrite transporter NrtS [uncultured Tateyamaria sp.]